MLLRPATIARTLFKTLATNRAALGMAFLFSTAVQLLFYLALLALGGLPLVGLWGWIMAAVALMPLFVLGWNQGLIKHIPEALAADNNTLAARLLGTALTGSLLFSATLGCLLGILTGLTHWTAILEPYLPPVAWWTWLAWLMPGLILVPLNQALQLAIDGKQQFIIRTGIQLNGLLILVITAPTSYFWMGETALPMALFFQQLTMLISGLRAARALNLIVGTWPFQWNVIAAKKLFQFGIRYQQASLLSALFDPVVKASITAMGGLTLMGLYELGNRMVLPFRNLLVQLLQVMTPAVARLTHPAEQASYIRARFWENGRYGTWGALGFLACIPLFAWLFPTGDSAGFRGLLHVLLFIWFINLWAAPLYYASMATGQLHDLLLVHAIQTGLAAGFLIFPGWRFAEWPLVLRLALPLTGVVVAAIYLLLKYRKIIRQPMRPEPALIGMPLLFFGSWMVADTPWFWLAPAFILVGLGVGWIYFRRWSRTGNEAEGINNRSNASPTTPLRISVITVCLNRAAFIEQTILSVEAQSYRNIEHIIIDGGSTDGTIGIIQQHAAKLHYWISEPDRGMYDAINKGIREATGDYIHVLNSDDYLAGPNVYADVVAAIDASNRAPFYHGNLMKVKEGEERLIRLFECGYLPYLMSGHGSFISHPTVFMHRDLHQRLGGYSLSIPYSSDFDYLLRACKLTQDGGIHLPITITCFREHAASFTGSGAIATEKKPMLAEHHFLLYPWWFRLGWYGLGWMFYKSLNFSKLYKKRPEVVGL